MSAQPSNRLEPHALSAVSSWVGVEPTLSARGGRMRRIGKPIEVAWGVRFLASDEAAFVTGAELVIDGGFIAQ